MNSSSRSATEFNVILALIGVSLFVMGLFHKKSRRMMGKVLNFGGGRAVDQVAKKYLPVNGYRLAKVASNYIPLYGSKGGKASGRTFRNSHRLKSSPKK